MKINKLLNTKSAQVVTLAVVVLGLAYVVEQKARKAVADVGQAVNPLNDDNIFASGVDGVGAKLSGDDNFKLGGWIYEQIHGKPDIDKMPSTGGVWGGVKEYDR